MKRVLLVICLATSLSCYSQVPNDSTKHKNIIGLDVTGLLSQFLNVNSTGWYYSSPYIVSYRRQLGNGNIRSAIGGFLRTSDGTQDDSLSSEQRQSDFALRLGYEVNAFSYRRWNFYYGCDFVYRYNYNLYRQTDFVSTHRVQESFSNNYGISPLCGLIYNLNERIALAVETSFDFYYSQNEFADLWAAPMYGSGGRKGEGQGWTTQYNAPVYLNLRIGF